MKSVKEILIEAAALGRKVGVARGQFITKEGSMCINGLIGAVINGGEPLKTVDEYGKMVRSDEYVQVMEVIAPVIGVSANWGSVANWNNRLEDTNEVLTALDAAAASIQ